MKIFTYLTIAILLSLINYHANAQLTLLTGPKGSDDYEMAKEIKKIYTDSLNIEETNGCVDNFRRLKNGAIAFIQYDVLCDEQGKDFTNNTNNLDSIRIVFPLGNREIHLIARSSKERPITSFADIKKEGVKVGVGRPGDGLRVTVQKMKKWTGAQWTDMELSFGESLKELLNGNIDAFFFIGTAPVENIEKITRLSPYEKQSLRLISINDAKLEGTYYTKRTIDKSTYSWINYDVETYSVNMCLIKNITSETDAARNNMVRLVADINQHILELQKGHPQWKLVNNSFGMYNDWDIHDEIVRLFIDKNKKIKKLNPNDTEFTGTSLVLLSGVEGASNHQIAQEIQSVYSSKMNVVATQGSIENFSLLDAGKIAFMQFDVLGDEQKKDFFNNTENVSKVRIVMPLGDEEIHLLARKPISSFEDIKKPNIRVGVGSAGQGTRVTVATIKEWTEAQWTDVEVSFGEAMQMLFKNELDALFFVGAAPVTKIQRISRLTPFERDSIRLIPITDTRLERSYYSKSIIPKNTYHWINYDIPTYAVRSLLITAVDNDNPMDKNNVKRLLRDIKSNILELQRAGHMQWKRVNFNYSDFEKWDIHPEARAMFLDKKKKEEVDNNANKPPNK